MACTAQTACATKTDASVGLKVAVIVCEPPGAILPLVGASVKGESQLQERSCDLAVIGDGKRLVPASITGQKPKSRLVGTCDDIFGMFALIGTMKMPFSVVNSMQSSYSSR